MYYTNYSGQNGLYLNKYTNDKIYVRGTAQNNECTT